MRYFLTLGLISALFVASAPQAQDSSPNSAEPEVLTRGPIHEAYATAVTGEVNSGVIATKPPPELIEELPPDEKPAGETVEWIPGYWAWDDDRSDYIWLSGFWRAPPPNRQWVPGTWRPISESQWQWSSGFWASADQEQVEYLPAPPPPVEAAPPPSPGDDYAYAPGTYVFYQTRYVWRPGFWYQFRPGWVYIPAHYVWTPVGYVFVDGYWDYPLQQRGVLFCPVYITPAMYAHRHFVYRPTVVVYSDGLFGALFVRPGCRSYFYGDYFAAGYRTAGYRSWIDIRIGGGGYDPLWAYYRTSHRHDPHWATGMHQVYAGRYSGVIQRPPRDWAQAREWPHRTQANNSNNNIQNNSNNSVVNSITNVNTFAPITQVDKTRLALKPITQVDKTQAINNTRQTRLAAVERVKLEGAPTPSLGAGKSDQPLREPRKVQLPKSAVKPPVAAPTSGPAAPPPVPIAPKFDPNIKPKEQLKAPKGNQPDRRDLDPRIKPKEPTKPNEPTTPVKPKELVPPTKDAQPTSPQKPKEITPPPANSPTAPIKPSSPVPNSPPAQPQKPKEIAPPPVNSPAPKQPTPPVNNNPPQVPKPITPVPIPPKQPAPPQAPPKAPQSPKKPDDPKEKEKQKQLQAVPQVPQYRPASQPPQLAPRLAPPPAQVPKPVPPQVNKPAPIPPQPPKQPVPRKPDKDDKKPEKEKK